MQHDYRIGILGADRVIEQPYPVDGYIHSVSPDGDGVGGIASAYPEAKPNTVDFSGSQSDVRPGARSPTVLAGPVRRPAQSAVRVGIQPSL
jgi:hypothetical protein